MIPIPLLVALLIAFGLDDFARPAPADSAREALAWTIGGVVALAALAFGLGGWTAWRARRTGRPSRRVRRVFSMGSRLLTVGLLGVHAAIIHLWGWPSLVLDSWGWRGSILIDDALILAPFLVAQLLVWWGMFYGERAILGIPSSHPGGRSARHLYLKERQSLALVLPIVLLFVARNDVIGALWPNWQKLPWAEPVELAALGIGILVISPVFIRLAWPTHPLPAGPLRDRLEAIADRAGFRCADILVWDTDQMMVNACVTGVLPRFRYVLLSDALIETLTPLELAAVFGHEVGHVAHRHLPFFLFFFVGCLALLTMVSGLFTDLGNRLAALLGLETGTLAMAPGIIEALIALACVGAFVWVVFGQLSRRFERQADIFGCKVVSRELPGGNPPPDPDLDSNPEVDSASSTWSICPAGVRIFSGALASVAHQNGIDAGARSWRHGSIASRIAFLQKLALAPEREPAFQKRVLRFRLGLTALLFGSLLLASAGLWFGLLD